MTKTLVYTRFGDLFLKNMFFILSRLRSFFLWGCRRIASWILRIGSWNLEYSNIGLWNSQDEISCPTQIGCPSASASASGLMDRGWIDRGWIDRPQPQPQSQPQPQPQTQPHTHPRRRFNPPPHWGRGRCFTPAPLCGFLHG